MHAHLGLHPRCHELGQGMHPDHEQAFNLYTQAANEDYSPAVWWLGLCYQEGIGTCIDQEKAKALKDKAIALGFRPV